jgi:hypothetical protein
MISVTMNMISIIFNSSKYSQKHAAIALTSSYHLGKGENIGLFFWKHSMYAIQSWIMQKYLYHTEYARCIAHEIDHQQ